MGDLKMACQPQKLRANGISVVFTVAANTGLYYTEKDGLKHYVFAANDTPVFNFAAKFDQLSDAIHK